MAIGGHAYALLKNESESFCDSSTWENREWLSFCLLYLGLTKDIFKADTLIF